MNRFKSIAGLLLLILSLLWGSVGCEDEKPTSGQFQQGDTLTGRWEGSYSVITNPGGVWSRDSMSISIYGFNDYFASSITVGVGTADSEVLADTALFTDSTISINGTGLIMGGTQSYSFTGSLDGPIFSGTVSFVSQTSNKSSVGNFIAVRQ